PSPRPSPLLRPPTRPRPRRFSPPCSVSNPSLSPPSAPVPQNPSSASGAVGAQRAVAHVCLPRRACRSEGDRVGGRGGVADQGGPPDLPRRPPHRRPPPPPRRPRRRGLPRFRAAPFLRGLHPPLPAPPQGHCGRVTVIRLLYG
uniref:Uncharacterized protein n=1 Tax=Aegilops tauschii subsp. strangulata TaxID=200361 RepID=A0A453LHI6_AEGTS